MNRRNKVSMGIGLSTLMMIFTVLCLTIFATLSFLQAKRSLKETDKMVNSSVEYYAADYRACEIYEYLEENLDDESYLASNNIKLENDVYSYSIKINDTLRLNVELKFENGTLNILKWQEVAIIDGDYDYQGFVH